MKVPLTFFLLLLLPLAAQDGIKEDSSASIPVIESATGPTAVTGPIEDGKPPASPEETAKPEFTVQSTFTQKIMREEPAPLAGMQPVRKQVTATVQVVDDPGLIDPAPPLPALDPRDPALLARIAEFRNKYSDREFVLLSATVYDHQKTLVQWYPNGLSNKPMTAWSNLDFNHLSGFAEYSFEGRQFCLLMAVSNLSSVLEQRQAGKRGKDYQSPTCPDLPQEPASFVVTEGDTNDRQAMDVICSLHALYKVEGEKLRLAYEGREKARLENEAYLRSNPPQPQDVTVTFWKRDHPVESSVPAGEVGQ